MTTAMPAPEPSLPAGAAVLDERSPVPHLAVVPDPPLVEPVAVAPLRAAKRWQGVLAVLGLVGAVVATALLVATPIHPAQGSPRPASGLLTGSEVAIRGGDPFIAYELADS